MEQDREEINTGYFEVSFNTSSRVRILEGTERTNERQGNSILQLARAQLLALRREMRESTPPPPPISVSPASTHWDESDVEEILSSAPASPASTHWDESDIVEIQSSAPASPASTHLDDSYMEEGSPSLLTEAAYMIDSPAPPDYSPSSPIYLPEGDSEHDEPNYERPQTPFSAEWDHAMKMLNSIPVPRVYTPPICNVCKDGQVYTNVIYRKCGICFANRALFRG